MEGKKMVLLALMMTPGFYGNTQEIKIIENHSDLQPHPLAIINSEFREINLSISPDGKYLYFMSLRGGNPWSVEGYSIFRGKSRFDGDIWYSKKAAGQWTDPICLPPPVNTSSAEDEPNISPDGNSVMYQSWKDSWLTDGGPYYISKLNGDKWENPEGMSGGINQYFKINFRDYEGYATDGASLSPDGNIFMVALAPDYNDSMDIYISRKDNGIWTYLKNTALSTSGDERSIFIAGDNKTVYFASNGYAGFGGMDIFKTILNDDDSFGEIQNIGKPFNSEKDDQGFIVTASGAESYFVRDDDIYYCDLRLAADELKPLPSIIISGVVTDIFGYPLESEITISKKETGQLKGKSTSNSKTGEYAVSILKEEGVFEKKVKANGHKIQKENFTLVDMGRFEEKTINTVLVEENTLLIHFDFDEVSLSEYDRSLLDSLVAEMYRNRRLRLMMEGHTDEQGTAEYNSSLSRERVEEVARYLREKGIPEGIMKLKAFGETSPRAGLTVVNRDALNRRVEIKVMELKR